MTKNMGTIDRVLRAIVGVVLIALAATSTIGWWGWIGIVPLVTSVVGICRRTCRLASRPAKAATLSMPDCAAN